MVNVPSSLQVVGDISDGLPLSLETNSLGSKASRAKVLFLKSHLTVSVK